MIRRLVVIGASGDLMERLLAPALATLRSRGALPDDFSVLGVALGNWDTPAFRLHIGAALEEHASQVDSAARDAFLGALSYARGDATSADDLRSALAGVDEPVAAYLALPPTILEPTVRALMEAGLPEGSRVAIEKPFGDDLESARVLNTLLHEAWAESALFRVDHFLAERAVQDLVSLRFANRLFEPIWNREHIERVEIVWEETLALEGRASFYDRTGALRDMIQSHLLQVLCPLAMEPPPSFDERDLRDGKVELLRAVRRLTPVEVEKQTVRARYTRGSIEGREVPSYVDEVGVDAARGSETFAQVVLHVENPRWQGVPFVLRTGKALGRNRREIVVHLLRAGGSAFGGAEPVGNVLRLGFVPATVALRLNVSEADNLGALEQVALASTLGESVLSPHAHVLLDFLGGGSTLSVRNDAAEESWRIVEPILDAWAAGSSPLGEYEAGSDGPQAE